MANYKTTIVQEVKRPGYRPLKPRQLAKKLHVQDDDYAAYRAAIKELLREGTIEVGANNAVVAVEQLGHVVGIYKRNSSGHGFVRPHPVDGVPQPEIFIRSGSEQDASSGDEVAVRITRKAGRARDAAGEVLRIVQRSTKTFVGTYFERDGETFVRVDGTVFAHSVQVADARAKGAKPQDKVVIEMLRFPTADDRGEGVITEVLGPLSEPGVDLITIVKAYSLPEAFPEAALAEARAQAEQFNEADLNGRVTIDPKTKHWVLTVHIADVSHFAPLGGPLDMEARKRATSIYLPRKVIPMFPEVISNGLASLQQGKLRYVKSVRIEFTQGVQKGHVELFHGAIRVRQRFSYEGVQAHLNHWDGLPHDAPPESTPEVLATLKRMRDLAALLRKKRLKRGSLELNMPEAVLDYDDQGRVSGAHFAVNDESHKIIEEFMLAANEAVAEHFTRMGLPFLRRVHPMPNEEKLEAFSHFAKLLGYPMKRSEDRFELQKVLSQSAEQPERAAIHFSLLRSLKQATYSPVQDEHYALAAQHYCHFTSPIRRYPDLTVHRLLHHWLKTRTGTATEAELKALGDHCSKMERHAETAERELVKLKLLQYLATRIGEEFDAVITGVADYGFFAQAEQVPAEGLVHISSLTDDYYEHDESSHTLVGRRKRYRLGDRVRVVVGRVDLQRRMLDFRLVEAKRPTAGKEKKPRGRG
jgi:ribonuclease R